MDTGELLTRWSVRVAVGLYALALDLRATAAVRRRWLACGRVLWTIGCLAFLLHVACAFQFYHHWSHAAAYAETARRTAKVVGWDWGGGLYANYAFALVWAADAAWWWWRPAGYYSRPRGVEWAVQGFMGFITFNATLVFGAGPARRLGLAVCLFLGVVLGYTAHRHRHASGRAAARA
jgi:hypothetical protein